MTLLGRVFESRANLESPQVPLSAANLSPLLGIPNSAAGITVTEELAMRLTAVYRCVELIAGTCAALPLKAYKLDTRERVTTYPVLTDPDPELTDFELWELAYTSLLLWGNAYLLKGFDGTGKVRRLSFIAPDRVRVKPIDPTNDQGGFYTGRKEFWIRDRNGREQRYTRKDILHIPGLGFDGIKGLSRIQASASSIATALAAQEYAERFFANGSHQSGVLTTEKNLPDESAAVALKKRWQDMVAGLKNAHQIAVLDNGAKFQPISIPPEDAQLLQTRSFSTTEIARLFGLPPHAIGDVEKSTSWGTGIEQQTIGMVQFTLQPSYLTRVEKRLTKEVLLDPNYYAEYSVEGLLRGDAAARSAFYTAMVQIKAMNPNEVRKRENLEPYEGGDEFVNPNITPGAAGGGGNSNQEPSNGNNS